jgi:hypothetical protein
VNSLSIEYEPTADATPDATTGATPDATTD